MNTTDRSGCWCAGRRQACDYHEAAAEGRDEERAAVVAWLNENNFTSTANAIERGEHRG